MDLVFLKTNRVHIFLFYFWFKSFPVLLLVLILISHFNFILVWFNLDFFYYFFIFIFFYDQLQRDFKQRKTKKFRTPYEIFAGHVKSMKIFAWGAKFRTPCEPNSHTKWKWANPCKIFLDLAKNLADHAKNFADLTLFRMLCKNLRGLRSNFVSPKSFRTLCENQEAPAKMKSHPLISF